MAEPRHASDEECTVSRGARIEQFAEIPETFIGAILADDFEHFFKFDAHDDGDRVAVAVIFHEDGFGFLKTVVGEEPANRQSAWVLGKRGIKFTIAEFLE